jgi:hypothetical protein
MMFNFLTLCTSSRDDLFVDVAVTMLFSAPQICVQDVKYTEWRIACGRFVRFVSVTCKYEIRSST